MVMLSMHAAAEYVFDALASGAHGYLLKEVAASEIVAAVRAVSNGQRYLCKRVADLVAEELSQRHVPNPLGSLSRREREILQLVAEGHTSAAIAIKLSLSPKTVDTYRSRLMRKLQIKAITELVKFALRHGLITLD
ncbi:MAG: DNA-binding response regulator [Betaproteobacteria bacterium]|nr:MAG: DNA-binding response regulator [Betaproteobacteria bacterium]